MPYATISDRIAGRTVRRESRANGLKLTELEEEVVIQRTLELDARGFAPRLASVEDIANYIRKSRGGSASERTGLNDSYNDDQS